MRHGIQIPFLFILIPFINYLRELSSHWNQIRGHQIFPFSYTTPGSCNYGDKSQLIPSSFIVLPNRTGDSLKRGNVTIAGTRTMTSCQLLPSIRSRDCVSLVVRLANISRITKFIPPFPMPLIILPLIILFMH